jgi:peptide/nickel transport system ATP-binding protein
VTAPLVEVRDLAVAYGPRRVASLPSLSLRRGECVALVGESGSGKTTVLLALLGLLDAGARVSGTVRVCGVDVTTGSERELRSVRGTGMALVLQDAQESLNPTMRLGTLLRRALARHGVRGRAARERVEEALASVWLPEWITRRYPHEVSGGQAQRLAIALAVALGADVLAADEPTRALDMTVQAEVMGVLQRLRAERGMALLLVSHDLALVSTVADRVVVMRDGEAVECGPTARVLTAPAHSYTRDLIAAVPTLGASRGS